jgi:hypothetical protein
VLEACGVWKCLFQGPDDASALQRGIFRVDPYRGKILGDGIFHVLVRLDIRSKIF